MTLSSIYRTHTCGALTATDVGTSVKLSGWVHRKRDHGALLFIDLRDNYGITQCVLDLTNLSGAEKIRPESCISIEGVVVARDASAINEKIPTGHIEINVSSYKILTMSEPLPFQVFGEEESNEDLRYKYRFLDLRREKLHKNILTRNKIIKFFRDEMWEMGFSEFQTPILTADSPEGARCFLVPSRLHHGEFYSLPQAPQMFKQLLMISGFDRYFQIAPCFRDEDLRSDRMLEFYQLDLEMSFVDMKDVQEIGNVLMPKMVKTFRPDAILDENIPHISFADAMLKYGSDKPDLRNPIEIFDATEIFRGSEFTIFANAIESGAVVRAIPAPNCADKPRSFFDKLGEFAVSELKLGGLGYIAFSDEVKGPIAKKLDSGSIEKLRLDNGAVFFICDIKNIAENAAGKLRTKLGNDLELINENEFKFCWVEDFPFFEQDENSPTGIAFGHNPFSRPVADMDNLDLSNPLELKAYQFDMVLNGHEICSGGLRNYNPDVMLKLCDVAGYSIEDVKRNFAGLYSGFGYGAPPHGGCGFGVDRLVSLMTGDDSIRENVAFPANQRGIDLLMGSPSAVSEKQLRELHIKIRDKA